jgi:hypothetical protein
MTHDQMTGPAAGHHGTWRSHREPSFNVPQKEKTMSLVMKRLEVLGVTLPHPAAPVANYVPFTRAGTLLFVSGQLPFGQDGKIASTHTGKLGPIRRPSRRAMRRGSARSI